MKATEITVLRLLQGSKVFLIPNFQRRYAWRLSQWIELWDDLLLEYGNEHDEYSQEIDGHFLGSIVLHPAPGPASTLMRHLVIDGQQRLTTLLVLLAALRDVRAVAEPGWDPNGYNAKYLTNPYDADYPDRLIPTEFDREPFVQTVRHGVPTGGIGQAYTFFRERIESEFAAGGIDLAKLGDVILIHMILVEINTTPGDSVNNIFNTLNSKGLPLSSTDLIRNELLLNLEETRANRVYSHLWLPMEKELVVDRGNGKTTDAGFVTFFWAREVSANPKTTKKNLFQSFERRLRRDLEVIPAAGRQDRVEEIFRDIYSDHELYRLIRDPHGEIDLWPDLGADIRNQLEELRSWDSEPHIPVTLWLLAEYRKQRITRTDLIATLRTVLGYLVRRALYGIPANNLNRLLSPIPSMIATDSSTEVAPQVRAILQRPGYRWPTDQEIRLSVATLPLYVAVKRSQTFYILSLAERLLSSKEFVDVQALTIEHIIPQSLPTGWREYLRRAGNDIDDVEASIHTLGNLTLTGHNSALGDDSFAEKREKLASSPLRMNAEVAAHSDWTLAQVRERSVRLADSVLRWLVGPDGTAQGSEYGDLERSVVRLRDSLQCMPEGSWISDGELVQYLGMDIPSLSKLMLHLGPELVRLVRDDAGEVPGWFPVEVRQKVLQQSEANLSAAGLITAERLAQLMTSEADGTDQEDVA